MFVENYYRIIEMMFDCRSSDTWKKTLRTGRGATFSPYNYMSNHNYIFAPGRSQTSSSGYVITTYPTSYSATYSNGTWRIAFGDGDTAPTINDYKLSGTLISTISVSSVTYDIYAEDGVAKWTSQYIIKNTGSKDIVIREIGSFFDVHTSNTSYGWPVLVERTVLDTPITIEPSNTATITYTIHSTYPVIPEEQAAMLLDTGDESTEPEPSEE